LRMRASMSATGSVNLIVLLLLSRPFASLVAKNLQRLDSHLVVVRHESFVFRDHP